MGCAASASGKAVPPQAGRSTGDKRKDAQTTYRERLGEDFMKDFAKSKHVIRETSTKSPNGSTVSAASTRAYTFDDDCIATGTLISPYTTPPTDSLPGAGAGVAGADVVRPSRAYERLITVGFEWTVRISIGESSFAREFKRRVAPSTAPRNSRIYEFAPRISRINGWFFGEGARG